MAMTNKQSLNIKPNKLHTSPDTKVQATKVQATKVQETKVQSPIIMTPEILVQGVVSLVSLPEVCIRISEMVDDPKYSAAQIGKIISQDASLTARLLRIVNSAFYQFPSKVETVTRAIAIVGHRDLRDLVIAAMVSGVFDRISTDLIDIDHFWRHGLYTGILSRIIAKKCRVLHGERLFIAGLLHDIGKLIMCYKLPKYAREAVALSLDKGVPIFKAETEIFGFNHAEVGAQLMKSWGFPDSHQNTALFHHSPALSDAFQLESSIVHLADRISHLAELGEHDTEDLKDIPVAVWKMTNMSVECIEPLLLEAREQFIEALLLFRPKGGGGGGGQSKNFAA